MEFVTQDAVERILGRLLTDARFRRRFFAERGVEHLQKFNLLDHERDSLVKIENPQMRSLVEMMAERLDPRIVRG